MVSVVAFLIVLIFGIKKIVDRYAQERVIPSSEQVQNLSGEPLSPEPSESTEEPGEDNAQKENAGEFDKSETSSAVTAPSAAPTVAPTPVPTTAPTPQPTLAPTSSPS